LNPNLVNKNDPFKTIVQFDFSHAVVVKTNELTDYSEEWRNSPREWWDLIYRAGNEYRRKKYVAARDLLHQAKNIAPLDYRAKPLLFRTLRKLTDKKLSRKLSVAIQLEIFEELFRDFPKDVTNYDRSRRNKFIDSNRSDLGIAQQEHLPILESTFEVTDITDWAVRHLSTDVSLGKELRGSTKWDFVRSAAHGVLMGKLVANSGNDQPQNDAQTEIPRSSGESQSKTLRNTQFLYWSSETNDTTNWCVPGKIVLADLASECDAVVSLDMHFMLRFTNTSGTCEVEYAIPVPNRDSRRASAISISPDWKRSVVTIADQLFVYDKFHGLISNLKIPLKQGWELLSFEQKNQESKGEINQDLEILGITSSSDPDEIRRVFRRQLRELHPDLNRDDPDANEKTINLIKAYERVMGESPENILEDSTKESETFRTVQSNNDSVFDIYMVGDGIDWVQSILLNDDSTFIFGTTSGHCVKANPKGVVEFAMNLGLHIYKVAIVRGILFSLVDRFIVSIDEKFDTQEIRFAESFMNFVASKQYLAYAKDKTVSLVGIDGSAGPTIQFKQQIRFIAITNQGLVVDSGSSQHLFDVKTAVKL